MAIEISVIIPTYNRAQTLRRAIESVIHQTSGNWELIIIDDGSTDDTKKIVENYRDSRIKYYYKKQSGVGDSRNEGISLSQGEFVTFLDSDDEAYPNWIKTLNEYLNKNTGMVSCGYNRVNYKGESVRVQPNEIGQIWSSIKINYKSGTLIFNRTILEDIGGFDSELRSGLNTDLILRAIPRLIKSKLNAYSINKPLLNVYEHSGVRIRKDPNKVVQGTISLINKHLSWLNKHPKEYHDYLQVVATNLFKLGQYYRGRVFLRKAIKIKFTLKNILRFFFSEIPFIRSKIWERK